MTEHSFDSPAFREYFFTREPLGALYGSGETRFRLWAPTAEGVTLRLWEEGEGGEPTEQAPMVPGSRGVWRLDRPGDLHGSCYDFLVTVDGETRAVPDPWARACGVNGRRSTVLDLRRAAPEGWEEDAPPPLQPETVIYELHVKDFSWDENSGIPAELRGKYGALGVTGTACRGRSTGLDYLRELGITHVQLQPVFDSASVDEAGPAEQYNWGYDPAHYNLPEGSYSSDPYRGEVRVRELREAVMALHRAGLRVVMDVVYNHTFSLDSPLWGSVPGYFYRRWPDGSLSNGSGCGNDLASERPMCARYILESVLYWAREYHMDGFRFDLMGLMEAGLIQEIRAALDGIYGPGEKLLLGEPWSAGDTAVPPGTLLAGREALPRLPGVAAFCDATRDTGKGSVFDEQGRGLCNGGELSAAALEPCLRGWAGCGPRFPALTPAQTVNYLSCHDDWTLWDKLVLTLDPQRRFEEGTAEVERANRLAAAFCFCCQGHLFLLAGEEFGRTKRGVKNSYNAPADLNRLDWARRAEREGLVAYYRGLIALRKRLPALRDKSPDAPRRFLWVRDAGEGCVTALADNRGGDSPWDRLLLAFHGGEVPCEIPLPEGEGWETLADGESSLLWQDPRPCGEKVTLPPCSAALFGRRMGG